MRRNSKLVPRINATAHAPARKEVDKRMKRAERARRAVAVAKARVARRRVAEAAAVARRARDAHQVWPRADANPQVKPKKANKLAL
jgi:hypothetical protein